MDAAVEERLKRLEVSAQPVSFLFLLRCFISACHFFNFSSLLSIQGVFFQHVYERVMTSSTVVSFPDEDEVEVEEVTSPTESDSRTPVSSSFLLSASSNSSFLGVVPLLL